MTSYTGNTTTSTPTIPTATSTTLVPANGFRKFLLIQNYSGASIGLNYEGQTLSGVTPTSTNKCHVLVNTGTIRFDYNFVPTGAITVYQTSGGSINTVTVIEG